MVKALENAGCKVDPERHFTCESCPLNGAFDAHENEVVLCANNIYSEGHMTDVVTHELIHAFDHCRGKVDFKDPRHLACTEIRAANLSGDCFWAKETFNRLQLGFKKHQQDCVRRRARRSVEAVTGISEAEANAAIDDVWDVCFNDTTPFDRIP